jgi:hypothetical protein
VQETDEDAGRVWMIVDGYLNHLAQYAIRRDMKGRLIAHSLTERFGAHINSMKYNSVQCKSIA